MRANAYTSNSNSEKRSLQSRGEVDDLDLTFYEQNDVMKIVLSM